jgi:hypothetical protein
MGMCVRCEHRQDHAWMHENCRLGETTPRRIHVAEAIKPPRMPMRQPQRVFVSRGLLT